jgi:hypothetical protein
LLLVARFNRSLHVLDEATTLAQSLHASHTLTADRTRREYTDCKADD